MWVNAPDGSENVKHAPDGIENEKAAKLSHAEHEERYDDNHIWDNKSYYDYVHPNCGTVLFKSGIYFVGDLTPLLELE